MAPLTDAAADSQRSVLTDHVEPGTIDITDGWSGYSGIDKLGYIHLHAANVPPVPAARTPASCCPWYTASPHW